MHIEKFTSSACGHMFKHYERYISPDGKPVNYSNENIDTTRSHLNYNLAPDRENQYAFMKERCAEVTCAKRKDLITMCSVILTKPKDLPSEISDREFFEAAYDFLSKRYGEENVISAYVHMDEASPHLHFSFIPICPNKEGELTVSAKRLISRQELKTLHPDAEKAISKALGREVHIMTGELAKGRKNMTLDKYKEMQEAIKETKKAREEYETIRTETRALEAKYEPIRAYVDAFAKEQEVIGENVVKKGADKVEMPLEKWKNHAMAYMDKKAVQEMRQQTEEMIREYIAYASGTKYDQLLTEHKALQDYTEKLIVANEQMGSQIDQINAMFAMDPAFGERYKKNLKRLQEQMQEHDNEEL